MKRQAERLSQGSPQGPRYDDDVKMRQMSVENVRKELGSLAKQGVEGELDEHVAVARHGKVGLFLVPAADYRRYRQLDGNPTEL